MTHRTATRILDVRAGDVLEGVEGSVTTRIKLLYVSRQTKSTFAFYARHMNRLSDGIVRMNDGNPSHTIEVRRAAK